MNRSSCPRVFSAFVPLVLPEVPLGSFTLVQSFPRPFLLSNPSFGRSSCPILAFQTFLRKASSLPFFSSSFSSSCISLVCPSLPNHYSFYSSLFPFPGQPFSLPLPPSISLSLAQPLSQLPPTLPSQPLPTLNPSFILPTPRSIPTAPSPATLLLSHPFDSPYPF